MSQTVSSAAQWLRSCSLVVGDATGTGIELAGPDAPQVLRIRFTVEQMVKQTPASLHARVYNLSDATIEHIIDLASQAPPSIEGLPSATSARVVLKAGYQENFGQLFQGEVYQLRRGRETNVDSFLDIFAADGDYANNWSYLRQSLAKGYKAQDVYQACATSMQPWQVAPGQPPDSLPDQPAPRGKVMFGPTREYLSDWAETYNCTWNIQNQQLLALPKFAVKPGEAIVINSRSGQIGVPEQTENGVKVLCLLNPALGWGSRVKLNNKEIARLALKNNSPGAFQISPNVQYANQGAYVPLLNDDGDYVVIFCRHTGDTRGREWFTDLTCLSIDPSATVPKAIATIEQPAPLLPG